jgi:hypothetical protein
MSEEENINKIASRYQYWEKNTQDLLDQLRKNETECETFDENLLYDIGINLNSANILKLWLSNRNEWETIADKEIIQHKNTMNKMYHFVKDFGGFESNDIKIFKSHLCLLQTFLVSIDKIENYPVEKNLTIQDFQGCGLTKTDCQNYQKSQLEQLKKDHQFVIDKLCLFLKNADSTNNQQFKLSNTNSLKIIKNFPDLPEEDLLNQSYNFNIEKEGKTSVLSFSFQFKPTEKNGQLEEIIFIRKEKNTLYS